MAPLVIRDRGDAGSSRVPSFVEDCNDKRLFVSNKIVNSIWEAFCRHAVTAKTLCVHTAKYGQRPQVRHNRVEGIVADLLSVLIVENDPIK